MAFVMVLSMVPTYVFAAEASRITFTHDKDEYFYSQLNDNAKGIYDAMWDMYQQGKFLTGTEDYDLTEAGGPLTSAEVLAYAQGDRTIFNDFAAAKDAFDLDHSEIWYLDSSYLSFKAAKSEDGTYHALMGIGRSDNYFLAGDASLAASVESKDAEVQAALSKIIAQANLDLAHAESKGYSEADKTAAIVRSVHNSVVNTLSYRFEDECKEGNEKYIRTLYALATHEGVCEAYARAMQVCLTQLGVDCVLIHGVQSSGTPEDHMWNAVNIPDEDGTDRWYVVDATWDDPLTADWFGRRDLVDVSKSGGVDGKENTTYLLVGQNIVGQNWLPSGNVSVGNVTDGDEPFEFQYPEINRASFDGSTMFQDENGLKVMYTAGAGTMEDVPAGCFTVTFQGDNAAKAKQKGFYFLIKMYQTHKDGTISEFQDWYYVDAALALMEGNKYFCDTEDGLRVYTASCDYVQIAVTTCKPVEVETWTVKPGQGHNALLENMDLGYFNGTPADIIGETDMLYNSESGYQAPPYILSQTPPTNIRYTAGTGEKMTIYWDDTLYHPDDENDRGPIANDPDVEQVNAFASEISNGDIMAIDNSAGETSRTQDDRASVVGQDVKVRYATFQPDINFEDLESHDLVGEVDFDTNEDGYVDDGVLTIFYQEELCPHHDEPGHKCSWELGCPIEGVEFPFTPSTQWADDLTIYQFYLEGVVGSKSWRTPNLAEVTVVCPSLCPYCYRSQGIDWNLWGKPRMLDNPDDLDLSQIAMEGVDGSEESLQELQERMKVDRMNGRLTLVAEDIGENGSSRMKYEEVTDALENKTELTANDIITKMMYEINFTKLCAKTIASTGDSMRIQIGYPKGFDYQQVLDSEVTFKAYHFTRDDDGKIVSVEEIPIIFTAYGMVIMVSSFSPFEIVGVDPSAVPASASAADTKTIIAAFGEGGAMYREDGVTKTVGTAGVIELHEGESATFSVSPDEDYQLDAVTFDGHEIAVNPVDNSVTITYDDITSTSCILNAEFIPSAVVEAEEEMGLTPIVADTASEFSNEVPARLEKNLSVGSGEEYDYSTIQDAIDAIADGSAITEKNISIDAQAGDAKQDWTITVAPGTYDRFVVLPGLDRLTISGGVGKEQPVIRVMNNASKPGDHDLYGEDLVHYASQSDGRGCIILAEDVTIGNLSFQSGGAMGAWGGYIFSSAIQAADGFSTASQKHHSASGLTVKNCTFTGSSNERGKGIVLYGPVGTYTIENNTFTGFTHAIWHQDTEGAPESIKIAGNTFSDLEHAYYYEFGKSITESNGEGSLSVTGNTMNGTSGKSMVVAILDLSKDVELADLSIKDNTMTHVAFIQHGLDGHQGIENVLDANDADESSLYIGIDDNTSGSHDAELHVSTRMPGRWVLSANAKNQIDAQDPSVEGGTAKHDITWSDRQYKTLAAYVDALIKEANASHSFTLQIPGLNAEELSDISEWLHQNISFERGDFEEDEPCKDGKHTWVDGQCSVCGETCQHVWKDGVCSVCGMTCKHENIGGVNGAEYKAPTCTAPGMTAGEQCSDCGKIFTEQSEIPAHGHLWKDGQCEYCHEHCDHQLVTDTTDATCTEAGSTRTHCSICGYVVSESEIPATGHTWKTDGTCEKCGFECLHGETEDVGEAKEPTCTEYGKTAGKKCSICGEILTPQADIAPTGHQHTEPIRDEIPATCTGNGLSAGERCKDCGATLSEPTEIPALGHHFERGRCTVCDERDPECIHENTRPYQEAKEATCTEDGHSEGLWCEDCDTIVEQPETYPANGHQYSKDGTCSICGEPCIHDMHDGVCSICGYEREHVWDILTGTCVNCGHKCEHVANYDRSFPATCTTPGLHSVHCSICGMTLEGPQELPATGHEWVNGVCDHCGTHCEHLHLETVSEAKEPTCTEPGVTKSEKCLDCGAIVMPAEGIPATGHQNKIPVQEEIPATCTDDGMTAGEKCADCGAILVEPTEIPAHGHSFSSGKCSVCGAIDPNCAHEHTRAYMEAKEPTCTVDGHTEGVWCEDCESVVEEPEILAATGHTEVTHNAKDPTCTEAGHSGETYCSVCQEVLVPGYEIAALGHTVVIDPGKAPTCTETGYTESSHCGVCHASLVEPEILHATGHEFVDGKCVICDEPQPDFHACLNGHKFVDGKCTRCGTPDPNYDPCANGHDYVDGHCTHCGKADPGVTEDPCKDGHDYKDGVCTRCGAKDPNYEPETEDPCKDGHNFKDGVCTRCGEKDPDYEPDPDDPCKDGHHFVFGRCTRCGALDPCRFGHTFDRYGFCIYCGTYDWTHTGEYRYDVEVGRSWNGKVSVSQSYANAGDYITIRVTPDDGYSLAELAVETRQGFEVPVTEEKDGLYSFEMPDASVVITATFERGCTVKAAATENGKVRLSQTVAEAGEKVTVRVTPDEGYVLDTLKAETIHGREISLVEGKNGSYSFEMPGIDVIVTATFKEEAKEPEQPVQPQQPVIPQIPDISQLPSSLPFTDVAAGTWYYNGVQYLYNFGIVTGTTATTFSPNMTTSRGQLVTMLWRLEGSPASAGTASYSDVPAGAYYAKAVQWATETGIVNGIGDSKFAPDANVTREQVATILYRYAIYKHYSTAVSNDYVLSAFSDSNAVSSFAVSGMRWLCDRGIMNGNGNGQLVPKNSATRAEIATLLYNFIIAMN